MLELSLSKNELAELQILADNPVALKAVKKAVLSGIYFQGTLRPDVDSFPMYNFLYSFVPANGQRSDAEVGQDLKAALEGARMVESGFSNIELFKKVSEEKKKKDNPAR